MPPGRPPIRHYDPEANERVDRLKRHLDCRTDRELAELAEVKVSQVTKWRQVGFAKSVNRIIDSLLAPN